MISVIVKIQCNISLQVRVDVHYYSKWTTNVLYVMCNSCVDINFTNNPFEQDERPVPKQQEFQAQVSFNIVCEL